MLKEQFRKSLLHAGVQALEGLSSAIARIPKMIEIDIKKFRIRGRVCTGYQLSIDEGMYGGIRYGSSRRHIVFQALHSKTALNRAICTALHVSFEVGIRKISHQTSSPGILLPCSQI